MNTREVNFDGLVGPTHNYAGLSPGNVASMKHRSSRSNPKEAALEGLQKMKALSELGLLQAVLPPQDRPSLRVLRNLGFRGTNAEILQNAAKSAPRILAACSSASSMWAANAATVAPSADTGDGKVHFTVANLSSKFHRSIESSGTSRVLRGIFTDARFFHHHEPLPGSYFGDEGAANHTRFCRTYGERGLHLFVFGRTAFEVSSRHPRKFAARQSKEASVSVARLHELRGEVLFVQQNPKAVDAGAFHNDVVSVGDRSLFIFHEDAFVDTAKVITNLQKVYKKLSGQKLALLRVSRKAVSLPEAVKTYLFNGQLVSPPDSPLPHLVLPVECQESARVRRFLEKESTECVEKVHFLNVRGSMRNGGGPACLRLRVVLTDEEMRACNRHVFYSAELHRWLADWVNRHYRDRLDPKDLADPLLLEESQRALEELGRKLELSLLDD